MRQRLIEATTAESKPYLLLRRSCAIDFDRYDRPRNMLNVYDIPWGADGVYRQDLVDSGADTASEQFAELPDYFKEALLLATVNEACEIANGNDIAVRVKTAFCLNLSVKQPICTSTSKVGECAV
ncbi:hypothetical protein [Klebsiella pneumoniae]|uniref:hypothetical protein n=1 Tax=Klebsiella pneumoniae TaxID=573 RepID=UPI003C12FF3C